MPNTWQISADWESLDSGTPEERACFAALGIHVRGHCLTEGRDALANRLRKAPYLSAYHLAQWLTWNWWRLRWEPRTGAPDWGFAHRLATIGDGYIWPDITIFSDGRRTVLTADATDERPETPFRYIAQAAVTIPSRDFETGVEDFIVQVLERLDSADRRDSNLAHLWRDLMAERQDPIMTRYRTIEALLGQEPDEGDPSRLNGLLQDSERLGFAGIVELAAGGGRAGADDLDEMTRRLGFEVCWNSALIPSAPALSVDRSSIPAWQLGAEAARAVRDSERLGADPISNRRLADLIGVDCKILDPPGETRGDLAFALTDAPGSGRIVLRSGWTAGRRFELARLLGDHVLEAATERFLPVTRAYTYRQKAQRAFAAEFLSPRQAVLDRLAGDWSSENQQEVANQFEVSDWTIHALLLDSGAVDRQTHQAEWVALRA